MKHRLHRCVILSVLAFVLPSLAKEATRPLRVLFVGDSITKHSPSPEKLGWRGNWGMAASAEAKDYVHLFLARLENESGVVPVALVEAAGGGKLAGQMKVLSNFTEFRADIAVVQMGENDREPSRESFEEPYAKIVQAIKAGNPEARIFCFGLWSPPQGSFFKDAMVRNVCRIHGATFVELHAQNADSVNQAAAEGRFTHAGVNWHPGDRGMQAYADALWNAYSGRTEKTQALAKVRGWQSSETWRGAGVALGWSPAPRIVSKGQESCAILDWERPRIFAALPAADIAGHTLRIKVRVAADASTAVTLSFLNAEGEHERHYGPAIAPSADWIEISWAVPVPGNVVGLQIEFESKNAKLGRLDFLTEAISEP